MTFEGAVIREQGVSFAIVIVKRMVIDSSFEANKAIQSFRPLFPGLPIILMAQDSQGIPSYYGRRDIVRFLANVPVQAIPWKRYTAS